MKTLVAACFILFFSACNNGEPLPALVSNGHFQQPMAELPIYVNGVIPTKTLEILHWDAVTSDFYGDHS